MNDSVAPILLDSGNALFKQQSVTSSQDLQTATGIMDIYRHIGYDGVAVGPNDLAAGVEFLKSGGPDMHWLSANLVGQDGKPIFPATRIITRGSLKIGFLGLTGKPSSVVMGLTFADWREILPEYLHKLSAECDMVLAVSSMNEAENSALVQQFPGIHLLITADRQRGSIPPTFNRDTLVTQTMSQGKYLGVLSIVWQAGRPWNKNNAPPVTAGESSDASANYNTFTSEFIPLSKNLQDDEKVAAMVTALTQQIAAQNQQRSGGAEVTLEGSQTFAKFAGTPRCRECHTPQGDGWSRSKHAQAYITLQQKQQHLNLDCLPCHITGARGADAPQSMPIAALLKPPAPLLAVGCEACHGAGLTHAQDPGADKRLKAIKEETCRSCHTKDRDPGFVFTERIAQIRCPAGH